MQHCQTCFITFLLWRCRSVNHGSRPTIVVFSWHSREHRSVRVQCLVWGVARRPALCFCGGERNVKGGGRSGGLRSVVCSCLFRWNQSRWVQTSGPERGLPSGQHMMLKQPCVDSAPPAAWLGKKELSYSVPWLKGLGPESVDANLEPCQTLFFFPSFLFLPASQTCVCPSWSRKTGEARPACCRHYWSIDKIPRLRFRSHPSSAEMNVIPACDEWRVCR